MVTGQYQSTASDYLIYLMHLASYRFATERVAAQRVLDYGCGSGYGSAMLAPGCQSVEGVDVSPDAIAHAQETYPAPNLRFSLIEPSATLPFETHTFDWVVSFQVIEHVRNVPQYLDEIVRVLRPGGGLIIATPDRATRLFAWQKPWNRWHVREYSASSLNRELLPHFAEVELLTMSGKRPVIEVELKRYRRTRLATVPFTFPFAPEAWRAFGLNCLHNLRVKPSNHLKTANYDFGEKDLAIGPNLRPSLNLFAIARTGA